MLDGSHGSSSSVIDVARFDGAGWHASEGRLEGRDGFVGKLEVREEVGKQRWSGSIFSVLGLMGNTIGKRRPVVEEKYTRPQGMFQRQDIDHKKLRKLILEYKLAPCYPGSEECNLDQEECPICFLFYPSLNRSRCCMKGICTECFLQLKPPHSASPTQCPFCKTSNYAVEYRGEQTKEEKVIEQIEEQIVIEAQIRLRKQEIQDEQERLKRRQEISASSRVVASQELEYHDENNMALSVSPNVYSDQVGFISSESLSTAPVDMQSFVRQNRGANLDMDLEDVMVMEAIRLSIQEQGCQRNPSSAVSVGSSRTVPGEDTECSIDNTSEIAEAGTSYAGSDIAVDMAAHSISLSEGVTFTTSHLLPESFEEQMMLAMAISLAEASAWSSPHGVTWI